MTINYFVFNRTVCLLSLFGLLNCSQIYTQEKDDSARITGFIDFNGYYDTRDYSVLTYNILVNLPKRFQYFSLTNYQGLDKSSDLATTFSEHNLRWGISTIIPLDLTLQYVLRNGTGNDDIRLGFRWKVNQEKRLKTFFEKLNLSYSINPTLVQFRKGNTTKYATQIEHVYTLLIAPKFFGKRLYLGGFADQNVEKSDTGGISFNWVSEHQVGFRLFHRVYVVLEYRINDYYPIDNYGWGYGLEYKIAF